MRHAKKGRKLGTDASHRKAMLRSLSASLIEHERIKTTEARAKEVRALTERIITWGKRGDVHSRRLALAELGDRALAHKVFDDIAERYADRDGGYTRILKLGPRKGDSAPMVIIELVD
ncbi:MAG: 50S ribosomal protein L17 [Coriobacteriia bacterium]